MQHNTCGMQLMLPVFGLTRLQLLVFKCSSSLKCVCQLTHAFQVVLSLTNMFGSPFQSWLLAAFYQPGSFLPLQLAIQSGSTSSLSFCWWKNFTSCLQSQLPRAKSCSTFQLYKLHTHIKLNVIDLVVNSLVGLWLCVLQHSILQEKSRFLHTCHSFSSSCSLCSQLSRRV